MIVPLPSNRTSNCIGWRCSAALACAVLVFCSCQQMPTQDMADGMNGCVAPIPAVGGTPHVTLPPEAWSGSSEPVDPAAPWRPPGIAGPWPAEEYLQDGGDVQLPAKVAADWTVTGLDQTDTIAHFDTLDGRTLVEPSNRVCVYSPRFGAVRRVAGLAANRSRDAATGVEQPEKIVVQDERQVPAKSLAQLQPIGDVGIRGSSVYRNRTLHEDTKLTRHAFGMRDALLPFENFEVIRAGVHDQREKARLAKAVQAAHTWMDVASVEVILDEKKAITDTKDEKVESVYHIEEADNPRLRIVKIASTCAAVPGETVDFTLRLDNVGDQPIGNVTILDNLTTRLEFVPESDSCTLKATFTSGPNAAGSQVLRWEITDPMPVGSGGVIRFRCRVR